MVCVPNLICIRWAILHCICRIEKVKVNKVKQIYGIILLIIQLARMYTFIILTMRLCALRNTSPLSFGVRYVIEFVGSQSKRE